MTMELLEQVLRENNIPKDAHFLSDSGWECDPTEMDGIFYNKQNNLIVFTQSGIYEDYESLEDWEILYSPGIIKMEGLEAYPILGNNPCGITATFREALKKAGDFEDYFGFPPTEELYRKLDLKRPLFYCIRRGGEYIGYIGFHGDRHALEPEMYLFEQYRHQGYGTIVLKKFIDIAFHNQMKDQKVPPEKLVSSVRVENTYSQKLMLACGFHENEEIAAKFIGFIREEGFIQVKEFCLTREEYLKKTEGTES